MFFFWILQVCAAYCHAKFLDAAHVAELVAAARFSLSEARVEDLKATLLEANSNFAPESPWVTMVGRWFMSFWGRFLGLFLRGKLAVRFMECNLILLSGFMWCMWCESKWPTTPPQPPNATTTPPPQRNTLPPTIMEVEHRPFGDKPHIFRSDPIFHFHDGRKGKALLRDHLRDTGG